MPTSQEFDACLRTKLEAEHVEVYDTSGGCGEAFEVVVVSKLFSGKNRLMRHKFVNSALKDQIAAVHAFTQKTYSPEEWEARGMQN